jgi:hypothetical protein
MARILFQTTIPYTPDDWHVGRFELLADELRAAGHEVTPETATPAPETTPCSEPSTRSTTTNCG